MGQDIQGSTVGIVGFGGIGQTIAKRLIPFEVKQIIYCGHSPKPQGRHKEEKQKCICALDALNKGTNSQSQKFYRQYRLCVIFEPN
jgi:lactate dehydrogenase-like 2-hydroxyacid dehydrogenase